MTSKLELKARKIATRAHKGQVRKEGSPYVIHPRAVVKLLKEAGVRNQDILAAAWLHDVIEDCGITAEHIEKELNKNVSRIVVALTRDVSRKAYKKRILSSDYAVKIIKVADVAHNSATLFGTLNKKTIKYKARDSEEFYLPLAKKISPYLYRKLRVYISPWLNFYGKNSKK